MIEILDIRDKTEEDSKEHEECVQPEWKERLLNVFLGGYVSPEFTPMECTRICE